MAPTSALSCPASDGLSFTAASGAVFNIHCGIDYYGGDLDRVTASTFEDCIAACSTTASCVDVSYNGDNCYMKKSAGFADPNDNVWTATLASTDSANAAKPTCPKSDGTTYTSASGIDFAITCDKNYARGDLSSFQTYSFDTCIDTCATTKGCIDVSFHHSFCYLKSDIAAPLEDEAETWSAKRVISCPADNGKTIKTSSGQEYLIACDSDFYGGDLSSFQTYSFDDCVETCDATPGCLDVAFHHSFCYLKNVVTTAESMTDSWTAIRIDAPTPVTPTPTIAPCPEGETCIVANGKRFALFPGQFFGLYGDEEIQHIDGLQSLEECATACSHNAQCIGVDFDISVYCALLSKIPDDIIEGYYNSAVLIQ